MAHGDDTDSSVEFSEGWTLGSEPGAQYYMNNERIAEGVGKSVKFTFNGCKARAYGTLDNKLGAFDVYIDGEFVENVRVSWGGPFCRLYQTTLLPDGKHTLELKAAEFRGSSKVTIDAFSFESPSNQDI